ncbi:MAG: trypsin-like peptidase domain-containing protein [Microthrixaceae bacterium]
MDPREPESGSPAASNQEAVPHFVPAPPPPRPGDVGQGAQGPPLFDPATPPLGGSPAGHRPPPTVSDGGWRTAARGGVVGALVASLLFGALFLLAPRREITEVRPADELRRDALNLGALLELVRPSVVAVNTGQRSGEEMFGGEGSGVVLSEDGLVLTNAHVVSGAPAISVDLADGRSRPATLVGSFPERDVAVIQMQNLDSPVVPAPLGSSADLKVGDEVVAIGNALGLGEDPSVTTGIVSAKGRSIEGPRGRLSDLIQTDAAINPGNSGGPLLDVSGNVVGINTAFAANSQNISFALEIDSVMPYVEDIEAGDSPVTANSPFLGVRTQDVGDLPEDIRVNFEVDETEGAFVISVVPDSGAQQTGLLKGDVIVELDGQPVATSGDVGELVADSKPGEKLAVTYIRAGERREAEVTMGRVGG